MKKASLIISFYNKIHDLALIFAALERQSVKDFEVIIADDGSASKVVQDIQKMMALSPLTVRHLWHEDIGFRKTKILNEAIRKSQTDYLIFIDGDCVPHFRFIEDHCSNRARNVLLAGRRVNLSERLSRRLSEEKIRAGYLEAGFTIKVLLDGIFGNSSHVFKGVYFKDSIIRKFLNRKVRGVLGCNFSIHKKDLLDINGFDERYVAPAVGEDTDVEFRLLWNNVEIRMLKNMAIQYHLYHQKLERASDNFRIFEEVKRSRTIFTPYGVNQTNTEERQNV